MRGEYLARGALLFYNAAVHKDYFVRYVAGESHFVSDDYHRYAAFGKRLHNG